MDAEGGEAELPQHGGRERRWCFVGGGQGQGGDGDQDGEGGGAGQGGVPVPPAGSQAAAGLPRGDRGGDRAGDPRAGQGGAGGEGEGGGNGAGGGRVRVAGDRRVLIFMGWRFLCRSVAGEAEEVAAVVQELVHIASRQHRGGALLGADEVQQDQPEQSGEDRPREDLPQRATRRNGQRPVGADCGRQRRKAPLR